MSSEEPQGPPPHVVEEWLKQCTCCPMCNRQRPCDGVMAGGLCDDDCECDYDDWPDEEE